MHAIAFLCSIAQEYNDCVSCFFCIVLFETIGYRSNGGRVIGKLVLYLAVSVDGYLADEQGGELAGGPSSFGTGQSQNWRIS